jgi:hypothetical protein
MLAPWGIDAREHRPRPLRRALCDEASAIFVMAPTYMHRLFLEYGQDLAPRAYLFADPFIGHNLALTVSIVSMISRLMIGRPMSWSGIIAGCVSRCGSWFTTFGHRRNNM